MLEIKKITKTFISPIKISDVILKHRKLGEVSLNSSPISEISPLEGLHKETLEDAISQFREFMENHNFDSIFFESLKSKNLTNLKWDQFGFGILKNSKEIQDKLFPSVKYAIELAILNTIDSNSYPLKNVCLLDFNQFLEKENGDVIKIKIGRNSIQEDRKKIEKYLLKTKYKFRLDGNKLFSHTDLSKLLDGIPVSRIDYIEDPFLNKSEFIKFTKCNKFNVNFAFDENLDLLLSNEHLYDSVKYAIIKPNLIGGISKTIEYTEKLLGKGKKVVISSSFEGPIGISGLNKIHFIHPSLFTETPGLDTLRYFKSTEKMHY